MSDLHKDKQSIYQTIKTKEKIAKLQKQVEDLKAENQSFGNVLAIIHRDGGHYITKHGHEKASEDAIEIVSTLKVELDKGEVVQAFYLEGLDKSEGQIKQLKAELAKAKVEALKYKKEVSLLSEALQVRSVDLHIFRDEIAKELGIDIESENWWDSYKEMQDEQLFRKMRELQALKEQKG